MIGIWFSFGPDSECLKHSIASFRRAYPDGIVTICDDPLNPIPEHIASSADHYSQRQWSSVGNLNGWPAIRGILEYQVKMHEMFPSHSGALKIDCDTLVLDSNWCDESSPMCGIDPGTASMYSGMCRYLRADVPRRLLEFIDGKFRWEDQLVPEDMTIAVCALSIYGNQCQSLSWLEYAASYDFEKRSIRDHAEFVQLVTFGNRNPLAKGSNDRRMLAAIEMDSFLCKRIESK